MSLPQYQKLLSVAETLLNKIDLPQDTLDKYQEFKQRLLEDTPPDLAQIEIQLQSALLAVHNTFLGTLQGILHTVTGKSTVQDTHTTLTHFVDFFNHKKQVLKDTVQQTLDMCSPAEKVGLSKYEDHIDELEHSLDKLVLTLVALEEQTKAHVDEINSCKDQIAKLSSDLEANQNLLRESEILSKELKVLKSAKDETEQALLSRERDIEVLKKELNQTEQTLTLKLQSAETTHKQSAHRSTELERLFDRLLGYARSVAPKQVQPSLTPRNLPALLDFLEDFTDNLLTDNRQLHTLLNQKEHSLRELQSHSTSTERIVSTRMEELKRLVAASNDCILSMDNQARSIEHLKSSLSVSHIHL